MHWKEFDYHKWKEEDDKFDHAAFDQALENVHDRSDGSLVKFAELVMDLVRPATRPQVWFNKDGDEIEVYLSDEANYGHWLTPQLCLHLSQETNEIVGLTISGVSKLISQDAPVV